MNQKELEQVVKDQGKYLHYLQQKINRSGTRVYSLERFLEVEADKADRETGKN